MQSSFGIVTFMSQLRRATAPVVGASFSAFGRPVTCQLWKMLHRAFAQGSLCPAEGAARRAARRAGRLGRAASCKKTLEVRR